ncbi:response regulator [Pseudodesulfovibrio sp.]|uniref:response regulator n=1 Tax=unclassified Pseudodesulfovibrio TaxID=2661612 RepID=UPI003B003EDF
MSGTVHVLLVDDETDFTATLARRLSRRGMAVETADSGEAGLEKLEHFAADVVLLDVRMPGMDGLSVLHRIKESDPLIEVVMLTGHASMEVAIRGMELGAFDYMMKPVAFEELLYKVEDAAARKRLQEGRIEGRRRAE